MDDLRIAEIGPVVERRAFGTRLKDWAAIFVMLSSAPALALIFTATPPVMPMIAAHFGAGHRPAIVIPWFGFEVDSTLFAQMITTLPSVGLMLGGAPTGLLVDRFGTRKVLIASLVAYGLFGSAGLYIDDAGLLLVSRFLLGFAAVGFAASTISLIGNRFVGEARARAVSYRQFAGGIGGMIATVIAGQIGEFGWHAPFALFLAVFTVVPIAVWAVPSTPASSQARAAGSAESLRFLWPTYLLVAGLAVVMMMNTNQLAFLLVDNGISSPALISRVIVMGSIMATVGSFLYSIVGPKVGMRWNYSLIAAGLGFGVVIIGLSHDAAITRIGVGLTGLGAGYMNPHFGRLVLDRAPPAARGRAVGLNFSSIYFGDLMNPFIVRPLAGMIGIHRAFLIVGAIVAASALQIVAPRRQAAGPVELSSVHHAAGGNESRTARP